MHAFKKLHEQSGLSLAIALLIFLACAMAGATILSATTASDGTLLDLKEDSHDTYLLDSAADYIISKAEDAYNNYYDSENKAETSTCQKVSGYSLKIKHGETEQEENDVAFYKNGDDIITFRRSYP
jgi:hypothetical protein